MSVVFRAFACLPLILFFTTSTSPAFELSFSGNSIRKLEVIDFSMSQDEVTQGDSVELFFRLTTLFGPRDKVRAFLKVRTNYFPRMIH